jgi:hypothetical protein
MSEQFRLHFGQVASALILAVSRGAASEILCIGTRGEGKTITALAAMGAHAIEHKKAGFFLPVPWAGIMSTFNEHKEKTHKSLLKPFWQGAWRIEDGGHKAILNAGGVDGVVLSLFGIEDTQAIDRVRGEWAGSWIDEAAPTLEGGGVDELVYDVVSTSLRVPTHAKVNLITENFPAEEHWTWGRFSPIIGKFGVSYHPDESQRMTIMIPKGDSTHITEKDRREWAQALKDRPDLAARLLEGRPGMVQLGQAVAEGFNESIHVSYERPFPVQGEQIFVGCDFGLTPTVIIGAEFQGKVEIFAALPCERGGIKQHLEFAVIPWFAKHAPWALNDMGIIQGSYDQSGDTPSQSNSDESPAQVLQDALAGYWQPGPVSWEGRKLPLLAILNRSVWGTPALQIDPIEGLPLIRALRGGWYYEKDRYGNVSRDLPKKNHPHSDLGDALCYMLSRIAPASAVKNLPPPKFTSVFDVRRMPGVRRYG